MREFQINLPSSAGTIDAFVCHPEEGGPHPAIIFYMDAPAIREELRDMVRRLASVGYYVMLPNLYYRKGTPENYGFDYALIRKDPTQLQKMFDLMHSLTNQMLIDDTAPMLKHIRSDSAAKKGPVGCVGYCMSGQFVMSVGAAYPDDFAAVASFYGVGIITDKQDSPHLIANRIKAEVYLAFAAKDVYVPDEQVAQMDGMLRSAGVKGRVEVYPGTEHGFAFPERPAYAKAASERHWETQLALFKRALN